MISDLWEIHAALDLAIVGRFGKEFANDRDTSMEPTQKFLEFVARCGLSTEGWGIVWRTREKARRLANQVADASELGDDGLLELLKGAEVAS